MLTRLLHACGLYLGPESALMPAQADNPEGFWEHLGFVALNDELLYELGGAWDLPPKADENFADPRLDPLRMKARLLIEGFHSASVWGWKDPRNTLTLPFWQDLLPTLKTLIVVRNPLEVAHSMRERNGTSYSFGLRLWEIYNRRLVQAAGKKDRLVTHYDSFFKNAESELRRIVRFIGLPDAKVENAAALVTTRRRHTHFTVDQLIDARVSAEVIELYRALIAEASPGKSNKARMATSPSGSRRTKPKEVDLLPGAVSRLHTSVPERSAQIERLYRELLSQAEARHKSEIEDINAHLVQAEARHKTEVEQFNADLAQAEARHKSQVEELMAHLAQTEARHKSQVEELTASYKTEVEEYKLQIARQEGHYTAELQVLHDQFAQANARHQTEAEHLRDRITQLNRLLHHRSVNLAEDERYIGELTDRLRKQLWNTRRLSHLLEDAEKAATRLRTSRRWKFANLGATLKAKLSHRKVSEGYGHLEKIVNAYAQWRTAHPEVAKIDQEIKAAQVPKIPRTALVETDEQVSSSDGSNKAGRAESRPPNKEPTTPAAPTPSLPLTSLHFPAHEQVEVSVIIPVFNQLQFTHACLASLQTAQERARFEVIIVDDCSTDKTTEVVAQIHGVVYLRNETNSGFIVSCNRGAAKARGKYLLFLNNDTTVKDGWLSALMNTFAEEPQAGAVGSKLVYPDGRLQEAGGIIWQDASGWNYGKFDDPQKPEYNYLRDVDYCSAAALMIPKALFLSVGGFDERYAPAYYEDTDLSFKTRK